MIDIVFKSDFLTDIRTPGIAGKLISMSYDGLNFLVGQINIFISSD